MFAIRALEFAEFRKLLPVRAMAGAIFSGALCGSAGTAKALPAYELTEIADPSFFSVDLRVRNDGSPALVNLPFVVGSFRGDEYNSRGEYAGTCAGNAGGISVRACSYAASTGPVQIPFNIPPSTFSVAFASAAYDVNERGDVLGGPTSVNNGNSNAGLQIYGVDGTLIDLGISSYRRPSFNNRYEVVGGQYQDGQSFYFFGGQWSLLDALVSNLNGFQILQPTDINDAGMIAGQGINAAGERRGFILTVASVPEPGVLALLLGVLPMLAGYRRVRARRRGVVRRGTT